MIKTTFAKVILLISLFAGASVLNIVALEYLTTAKEIDSLIPGSLKGFAEPRINKPKVVQTSLTEYTVYITQPIGAPYLYDEVVAMIMTRSANETIIFEINSPGGEVLTMGYIMDAMDKTPAKKIANISGLVASAAAMITLNCDEINVSEGTIFMLHNVQMGVQGTPKAIVEQATAIGKAMDAVLTKELKDFLSPEDMQGIIDGKEVWMDKEELDRHVKERNEKHAAQVKAA